MSHTIVRTHDNDSSPVVWWEPLTTTAVGVLLMCVGFVFYI